MGRIVANIAILAGTYIVIDQYHLFMKRRSQKKAQEG